MAMATDIFGLNRQSITESFDEYNDINLEAELANVEPLEEGVDPMEYMVQVACECEIDMQRIEMGIVSEEYAYLRENGEEMVYEASSANGIIDKFKKWIDKLWASIQKFFRSILSKFSERFLTDAQFAKRYEDKVKKIPTSEAVGLGFNAYDIAIAECKAILTNCASQVGRVSRDMEDSDEYSEEIKKCKKAIFSEAGIEDEEDSVAQIIRKYKLKTDKETRVQKNQSTAKAIDILKKSEAYKLYIKENYNNSKKVIANAKKAAKDLESKCKRFKVLPTEESSKIHRTVKVINKIGSWCTQANKVAVQYLNQQCSFARSVIINALKVDKDKEKTDKALAKAGTSRNQLNRRGADLD